MQMLALFLINFFVAQIKLLFVLKRYTTLFIHPFRILRKVGNSLTFLSKTMI